MYEESASGFVGEFELEYCGFAGVWVPLVLCACMYVCMCVYVRACAGIETYASGVWVIITQVFGIIVTALQPS